MFITKYLKPGIRTHYIYTLFDAFLDKLNIETAVLMDYKDKLCVSINNEVCHGYRKEVYLKEGDIINIDICLKKNKSFVDGARSFKIVKNSFEVISKYQTKHLNILKNIGKTWSSLKNVNGYCNRYYLVHGLNGELHSKPLLTKNNCKNLKITENKAYAIEFMWTKGYIFKDVDEFLMLSNSNVFHTEDSIFVTRDKIYILTYDELFYPRI